MMMMRFGTMFAGCIFAQIFIEYILKYDAGAANCVTLAEISVVLVHAMLTSSRRTLLLQEKLRARMDHHVIHALLWVTISWLVNWAYSWKVGVPLHTLFRSSNIVSNVVVGVILFKHRYSTIELLGVVAVTAGIFLATIADASGRSCAGYTCSWADIVSGSAHPQIGEEDDTLTWKIGIGILVIVSLLQGLLGHVQKQMYDVTVGDRTAVANEFLFISHAFALGRISTFRLAQSAHHDYRDVDKEIRHRVRQRSMVPEPVDSIAYFDMDKWRDKMLISGDQYR
eukprot:GEMP01056470.1.p1 GENE.GEMP01056470.1~~GEMP01056470.1.p1  ORF type:complete len:283 (+),score=55.41 GEMP01056470.1:65-913(+)